MPRKWEVTKAVRASELPGPAKCVMFVLCDIADVGTAEVPERFTPSLDVLAREAGFGRSTVARQLIVLEKDGWLTREVMTTGRNRYRLLIPWAPDDEPVTVEERDAVPDEDPSQSETDNQVDESRSGTAQPSRQSRSDSVDNPAAGLPYKEARSTPDQEPSSSSATPPREDVERICQHLADRMIANGCKPPTITKKWRDAARLLLDKDGRTEDQVHRAIEWATAHHFWAANILSLPTLREKYDQLRLRAEQERDAANGQRASPRQNPDPAPYHKPWTPEED